MIERETLTARLEAAAMVGMNTAVWADTAAHARRPAMARIRTNIWWIPLVDESLVPGARFELAWHKAERF